MPPAASSPCTARSARRHRTRRRPSLRALQPQLADNYEIGVKSSFGDAFAELTVFHVELRNELIPFELAASPGRTFYSNAGSSTRGGFEAALSWKGESGFGADLSYTWSDFCFDEFVDDAGNDFGGKRLPGQPEHFAYLGLTYESDAGLAATYETLYSGDLHADNANATSVSSYVVSNLRASYAWERRKWLVRPYVGINNVFDERYFGNIPINGFDGRFYEPAPERNFYAGVTVQFRKPGH